MGAESKAKLEAEAILKEYQALRKQAEETNEKLKGVLETYKDIDKNQKKTAEHYDATSGAYQRMDDTYTRIGERWDTTRKLYFVAMAVTLGASVLWMIRKDKRYYKR